MTYSVPTTDPSDKSQYVYYAHLDDQAGLLAKLSGRLVFMDDATETLTELMPEHLPFVTVLGHVGLSDMQQYRDKMHGGAAKIACNRNN